MGQSASDVRAGGAFYEMSMRDNLTPALAGLKARVEKWGRVIANLNPGAGGSGFLNRLVFGAKDVDAKSGEYLGRVGGLIAPLRTLFSPGGSGEGLVNRLIFGDKQKDAAGAYLGRAGGLIAPLRALFSSGAAGDGLVNRLVFGRKLDIMGQYVGRVGGLKGYLGGLFNSGAAGSGLVNTWLFGAKRQDENGQMTARIGGLVPLARSAGSAIVGTFGSAAASARQLGAAIAKVGIGLTALGGAVGAPLLAFFKAGIDRAADLARKSRQLGVSVVALNKLQYAADAAGVSLDEVGQDRTGRYADLIAKAPEINSDDAKAAAEAQLALSDATRALQDALVPLVQTVAPLVQQFAAWVKANAGVLAVVTPLAAAVTGLGIALGVTGVALAGIVGAAAAVGSALVSVIGFVAAFWEVLLPVAAIVAGASAAGAVAAAGLAAAVGGLGYAFFTMTDSGRALAAVIAGDVTDAFGTAKGAFGAFKNALQKGDLTQAFEVAAAGLELLWAGTVAKFEKGWADFKGYFVDGWHEITGGLAAPLQAMWQDVKGVFNGIWDTVKQVGAKIEETWNDVWNRAREPVMRVLAFLAPIGALIAGPFIAGAALIKAIWENLDASIYVNLINFGAWVKQTWARIGGTIENVFKKVARAALDAVVKIAEALKSIDPTGKLTGDLDAGIAAANKLKAAIGPDIDIERKVGAYETEKKVILEKHAADQKDEKKNRQTERGADVAGAEAGVAASQKRLTDALAAANAARPPAPPEKLTALKEGLAGGISVKGGFSGSALGQQFGVGNEVNKQTEWLKAINATLMGQPAATARALEPLVRPGVIR